MDDKHVWQSYLHAAMLQKRRVKMCDDFISFVLLRVVVLETSSYLCLTLLLSLLLLLLA